MTSITSPNNLSPAMLSSSSTRLSTTDQMQSARNRQASDNKRPASSPVEYRLSLGGFLALSDIFRTVKLPENEFRIESKICAVAPALDFPCRRRGDESLTKKILNLKWIP